MSIVETGLAISLEVACDYRECAEFAHPLFKQLSEGGYDVMSVLPIPDSIEEWRDEHRTARKRADRAARRGYRFVLVRPHERNDELHEINVSAPERQGRAMSEGYQRRPQYTQDPVYPCLRHCVRRYGVEHEDGTLVAYAWIYRSGSLALVSQILGHARHLENEAMFLLAQGVVDCESCEPGFLVYNKHNSGTDGLRFFKERLGFAPTEVRWSI